MDKSEILKKAIKKSAEYVSSIKEPARRAVVKTSKQEGFIDGVCFTQTWISPLIEKPDVTRKIAFKLKNNDIRFGNFFIKDQFDRENIFCDGSFHNLEAVEGWMYIPMF